ncbi:MAG: DUF3284 domain-containing protein [Erysipelotrichia bacterium]|nr:DUF3284 domain-containing protein [Erysipelotrichia bacterium]
MQVTSVIEVGADAFFDYLVKMHQDAATQSSKRTLSRKENLDGAVYDCQVQFGKDRRSIQIHIGPVLENRYFEVSYETKKERVKYFYDLAAVDYHHCQVTYCEETVPLVKKAGILNNIQKKYDNTQAAIAAQSAIAKIEKAILREERESRKH